MVSEGTNGGIKRKKGLEPLGTWQFGGEGDRQHTVSPHYQAISFKYIYQLLTKNYCTN